MINPTGKKLQKIISKLIDNEIEGFDKYIYNGSTWLIFTDQKKWIVEYTEDNTLWYNYYFFTDVFNILNLKTIHNEDLIQGWFESRFLNIKPIEDTIQNGVKDTQGIVKDGTNGIEDTIQNGVKDTQFRQIPMNYSIEDTIQNGVKDTSPEKWPTLAIVEDTIQNGVKHIHPSLLSSFQTVEDTIQNGVKHIACESHMGSKKVEDTIQNGIKDILLRQNVPVIFIEDTIQNGRVEMIGTGFATPNELNDIIETNKITE